MLASLQNTIDFKSEFKSKIVIQKIVFCLPEIKKVTLKIETEIANVKNTATKRTLSQSLDNIKRFYSVLLQITSLKGKVLNLHGKILHQLKILNALGVSTMNSIKCFENYDVTEHVERFKSNHFELESQRKVIQWIQEQILFCQQNASVGSDDFSEVYNPLQQDVRILKKIFQRVDLKDIESLLYCRYGGEIHAPLSMKLQAFINQLTQRMEEETRSAGENSSERCLNNHLDLGLALKSKDRDFQQLNVLEEILQQCSSTIQFQHNDTLKRKQTLSTEYLSRKTRLEYALEIQQFCEKLNSIEVTLQSDSEYLFKLENSNLDDLELTCAIETFQSTNIASIKGYINMIATLKDNLLRPIDTRQTSDLQLNFQRVIDEYYKLQSKVQSWLKQLHYKRDLEEFMREAIEVTNRIEKAIQITSTIFEPAKNEFMVRKCKEKGEKLENSNNCYNKKMVVACLSSLNDKWEQFLVAKRLLVLKEFDLTFKQIDPLGLTLQNLESLSNENCEPIKVKRDLEVILDNVKKSYCRLLDKHAEFLGLEP